MTQSEARTALTRLHAALDAHLEAVEKKTGENDPIVQAAFLELREASTAYDEAIFDEHDEVTPFDLPPLPEAEDEDDSYGPRLSVLARWDFSIADADLLMAAASSTLGEEVDDPAVAATLLAHMGARRGLGASAAGAAVGLFWHGSVTATVPCEIEDAEDVEWMEDAFVQVDSEDVLCVVSDVPDFSELSNAAPPS